MREEQRIQTKDSGDLPTRAGSPLHSDMVRRRVKDGQSCVRFGPAVNRLFVYTLATCLSQVNYATDPMVIMGTRHA